MSKKIPEKWGMEVDVVVVGSGAAGFTAAITAHDHGAKKTELRWGYSFIRWRLVGSQ